MTINNELVLHIQKLIAAIDAMLRVPTKNGGIPADSTEVQQLMEAADRAAKYLTEY